MEDTEMTEELDDLVLRARTGGAFNTVVAELRKGNLDEKEEKILNLLIMAMIADNIDQVSAMLETKI